MTLKIRLPDLNAEWKWPRRMNPHTADIQEESSEWVTKFKAFTPEAQKAFDKCNFNLLTGLSYPWLDRGKTPMDTSVFESKVADSTLVSMGIDQLRSACDLMNLFFVFDEHSDRCSGSEVWNQTRIIMDALHNPEKPRQKGEWIGGEIARQFWERVLKISTPTFQRRFLATWESYLHGTAQQADDRSHSHIRDIKSYMDVRRKTIGARPSFNMLEMGMNLPDEVLEDATICALHNLAIDLTIIANDIISYDKEQASGDDEHNLIVIAMKDLNLDVQGAIDWAASLHTKMVREFNCLYLEMPRWGGPLDLEVQSYVNGLAHWVAAYVHWSYESERYFGKRGPEIQETLIMHLTPKKSSYNAVKA